MITIYKKVKAIEFGLLGPKDIKKMAAAKVVTAELYDKEGYPVDGGLMDIRLGVIDPGLRCKTCGGKIKECIGHFGYIELARPVIHIHFVNVILAFLRSTCKECGKLLITDEERNKYKKYLEKIYNDKGVEQMRKKRSEILSKVKAIKKCPHCKAKQPSYKIEKPTTYLENDRKMSPIEVRIKLEKIPDEDVEFVGLNPLKARPEWAILTLLPIPPVTIRPSITLESGERSEDDLTHKLSDIVRINQRLFENINAGAPEIIIDDLWELLQYHVTTFFDNTVASIPPARQRSGGILKTLAQKIKSKEGRFRHNLAGKRVNFSARSVISPDPKLKFNEVGVPLIVAMELTVPEKVTEWNIDWLKELIKNGPKTYPGANYVVRPDGKKKHITEETITALLEELVPGYSVERHLRNEDIALFNRQPSLHRMSIMCHRVVVMPGKSFRINPAVTIPYAGDFDGDEMNLHIPQTEEARAEAEVLMEVQTQIITPKNGTNIIGCIEDAITGNYILTKETEYTKEEAIQILQSIGVTNAKFKSEKVDGKAIFSTLLPEGLDYIGSARACHYNLNCADCAYNKNNKCSKDAYVEIRDGKIIKGIIDDNAIGEGKGGLVRAIYTKYGPNVTLEVVGKIFMLGNAVLLKRGFTTSLSDTDLPQESISKIKELLDDAKKKVYEFIQNYKDGKLEPYPNKTLEETLELKILELLNKVRNKVGEVTSQSSNQDTNPTIIMAACGAQGKLLNLAQMAGCVGQQSLRGMRIRKGYHNRTLPIFKKGDMGPEAGGFIGRGYKEGLKPYEYFFAAMTGRDSLMDTALRTPKSGYLYRRLSNALQDIKIGYDYTVRDAKDNIIQFTYGDDNIDVSKSEGGIINVKRIIKQVLEKNKGK